MERRGPYSGIGETMARLRDWMDLKGVSPAGYPFCLYYDNPQEIPATDLRSEACIPVSAPFDPEGDFRMKEMPESRVAETKHKGPPEEFAKTYGPFLEGLLDAGYKIVGPAREFYTEVALVKGPGSGFLIQQPVAKQA